MLGLTLGVAISGVLLVIFGYETNVSGISLLGFEQRIEFTNALNDVMLVSSIISAIGTLSVLLLRREAKLIGQAVE